MKYLLTLSVFLASLAPIAAQADPPAAWASLSDAQLSRVCGQNGVEDTTTCANVAQAEINRAKRYEPGSNKYCSNLMLAGLNTQLSSVYAARQDLDSLIPMARSVTRSIYKLVVQKCDDPYESSARHMLNSLDDTE
jgi:hypothetical protein